MAENKKIFSDLFQDTNLAKRLENPTDRKIVEETLSGLVDMRALNPQEPLTPGDIAYFLSDFEYGSLYFLCGLITPEKLKTIPDFFDPKFELQIPKPVLKTLEELKNIFEVKSIQLNAIEADIGVMELSEGDYFDIDKEQVRAQVPYDFMSDFTRMKNYQLILNYVEKTDNYENFVEAAVYLSDAVVAAALNAIDNLRKQAKSFNDQEIQKRVSAMCNLFEAVAVNEESYGSMTDEAIRANLAEVDMHMRRGLMHMSKGNEAKKTKYLQLLDLLTKQKKDIPFLDEEKCLQEDEKDREAFLEKICNPAGISKQTQDEIDFAVGAEILQTMAANIGKDPEEVSSDDVLMYLTDTNAANLYYTCGFLSEQEYKVFYRVMFELEQEYNTGLTPLELKDFTLPQLLDKACELNPRISVHDRRRIRECYNNYAPVVEYFKKACEVVLAVSGIPGELPQQYNLTNPKGVFAKASEKFADTDFVRTSHIAHMLNAPDMTAHGEDYKKSRLLATYLADYYYHDALEKMRAAGAAADAVGIQTSTRVMNDYLYGVTQKCKLSKERAAHTADLLVAHTRRALGMTLENAAVQTALKRFDAAMGEKTVARIYENSWKRLGLLNPARASSYMKER